MNFSFTDFVLKCFKHLHIYLYLEDVFFLYFLVSVHPCLYPVGEKGGCQHTCVEKGDEKLCKCNEGFVLGQDNKKCNPCKLFTFRDKSFMLWIMLSIKSNMLAFGHSITVKA